VYELGMERGWPDAVRRLHRQHHPRVVCHVEGVKHESWLVKVKTRTKGRRLARSGGNMERL